MGCSDVKLWLKDRDDATPRAGAPNQQPVLVPRQLLGLRPHHIASLINVVQALATVLMLRALFALRLVAVVVNKTVGNNGVDEGPMHPLCAQQNVTTRGQLVE